MQKTEGGDSTLTLESNDFDLLIHQIKKEKGIDLSNYKSSFIKRRLGIRLQNTGNIDYDKYAEYLDNCPNEYDELVKSLSINVTAFFRDPYVFESFSKLIVPKLLKNNKSHQGITVLSVGCATGEEVYSLAMQMTELLNDSVPFKIHGIDVSKKAIDYAQKGEFSTINNIPKLFLVKYFEPERHGTYRIMEQIQKHTQFHIENVVNFNSLINYDVIFCRNMFMYLEKNTQGKVFEKFHKMLKQHGFLILGGSETIIGKPSELFEPVLIHERVYKKRDLTS